MGKFDALLGRNFKAYKFKATLNLAISRLAVLKNQRQARCSLARSDIVQILNLGHHDRALLRAEQVIKEQNMLDVFVMIEGYCHLLAERINLLEHEKVCPEELKEAASGLLYASTRCGEFPELIELRAIFTSRFGKEFPARAMELRNNCGVNPKMIQKLSTRHPSLENKLEVLKEIAAENNIILQIEEDSSMNREEKLKTEPNPHQSKPELVANLGGYMGGEDLHDLTEEIENMEELSDSIKARRKYKGVADAAEAAFKSAAYAAAAARIAVELSKSENHDPNDQSGPGSGRGRVTDENSGRKSEVQTTTDEKELRRNEDENVERGFNGDIIRNYHFESEDEEIQCEVKGGNSKQSRKIANGLNLNSDASKEGNFDEGDDESTTRQSEVLSLKSDDLGSDSKLSFVMNEDAESKKLNTFTEENLFGTDDAELYRSQKKFPLRSEVGPKAGSGIRNPVERRPISVRTRLRAWIS